MDGGAGAYRVRKASADSTRRMLDRVVLTGSLLEMQEHFADAARVYLTGLTIDSTSSILYYALAKCYASLHNNDSALIFARQAARLDTNNINAHQQLAHAGGGEPSTEGVVDPLTNLSGALETPGGHFLFEPVDLGSGQSAGVAFVLQGA